MYYDFIQTNKRRIIIAIWILFISVIAWAVWIYVSRIGKLPLVVSTVPSNASVSIGGQNYGNGTQWLLPGSYAVKVEKDGFSPRQETIIVSVKKDQNVLAVSLDPQSNTAKQWVSEHQSDYMNNEQYGSIQANTDGKYFTDLNPITTKLPYTDPYFTIGYSANNDQTVTLNVTTPSPRYRFYAVEKIRSLGYDPTNFKIEFKDFHSPLGQK